MSNQPKADINVVSLEKYRRTLPQCGYTEFDTLGDRTYCVVVRDHAGHYRIIGGFTSWETAEAHLQKILRASQVT